MTAALKFSPTAAVAGSCSASPPDSLSASQAAVGSLSGESFATSRAAEMVAQVTESLAKVLPRDVAEERARNVVAGFMLVAWDAFDAGHAQGVRDEKADRRDEDEAAELGGSE